MEKRKEEKIKTKIITKNICCLTWNMHGQTPSNEDINKLLKNHKEKNYDIYVIGSQECLRSIFKSLFYSDKSIWENQLKIFFGNEYEMLLSVTLAAINMIIFIKKNLKEEIKDINYNTIKTGVYNYLGNKGAVGIWFTLLNLNIMFINSHLAANKKFSEKRNDNLEYIMQNMNPRYLNLDFIVFMGDLNYRLNNALININDIKINYLKYLEFDQLTFERKKIKSVLGFKEGKIKFLPTFKYKNNTDEFEYDNINKQPAWTDRILYIKRETSFNVFDVEQKEYNSMQNVLMSDHKPVYSYFYLSVRV